MIDPLPESASEPWLDPIPRRHRRPSDPPPSTGETPAVDRSTPDEAELALLAIVERVTAHGVVIAGCSRPVSAGVRPPGVVPLPPGRDPRGREAALLSRLLRELRGREDHPASRTDEQRGLEARLVAEAVAAALGWPVRRTGAVAWAGTMAELGASLGSARRLIQAAVLGSTPPPHRQDHLGG